MSKYLILAVMLVSVGIATVGCGEKEEPPPPKGAEGQLPEAAPASDGSNAMTKPAPGGGQ
jgi:hypothetical protein